MKYLTNREAIEAMWAGKKIEWLAPGHVTGIDYTKPDAITGYTLAPETITRTITYSAPYKGPMDIGQNYFIPAIAADDFHSGARWEDDVCDNMWLARGLVHLSIEAAIAHAKTLIGGEG